MKHVYAVLLGVAVLTGGLFATSTPADAKWCFKYCQSFIYTQTCKWVQTPPPAHLVCTWKKVCAKWATVCLPQKQLDLDRLPHVIPAPPPPPDPLRDLFQLPQ